MIANRPPEAHKSSKIGKNVQAAHRQVVLLASLLDKPYQGCRREPTYTTASQGERSFDLEILRKSATFLLTGWLTRRISKPIRRLPSRTLPRLQAAGKCPIHGCSFRDTRFLCRLKANQKTNHTFLGSPISRQTHARFPWRLPLVAPGSQEVAK